MSPHNTTIMLIGQVCVVHSDTSFTEVVLFRGGFEDLRNCPLYVGEDGNGIRHTVSFI